MNETGSNSSHGETSKIGGLLAIRTAFGLGQGCLLYLMFEAARSHTWPATDGQVFAPLFLVVGLVPLVLIAGCAQISLKRLAIWAALLAFVLAVFGYHDIWRGAEPLYRASGFSACMPSARVGFFSGVLVFIAYPLISAGEAEKRWIAAYETYFDTSWKLAVQLQFSTLFVGAFWMLLWAGAALFQLIGLGFFQRLLQELWFSVPATTLALAAAIHLTDVRPGIVRSIRTLLLTLQSWLLPLLALIVGGFLCSIPFTGLATLWATRHAAALLLGVSAAVVILVNTTFQQGRPGPEVPAVLRYSARVACLFLTPMALIAAYALWLRIDQYGLTTDRIIAGACLLVACCYAVGYGWAALRRSDWLGLIAPTNVLTSYVVLAVLAALFTPIADPARLSVNRQVSGLASGRVAPEKFDFSYLRFETARYGREALETLAKEASGPRAAEISERAMKSLQQKNRWEKQKPALTPGGVVENLHIRTPSARLADDFLSMDWQARWKPWRLPNCLTATGAKCDTYIADFTGDSRPDVLLLPSAGQGVLFGRDEKDQWQIVARLGTMAGCGERRDALAANEYRLVAPTLPDLEIKGKRFHLAPDSNTEEKCR